MRRPLLFTILLLSIVSLSTTAQTRPYFDWSQKVDEAHDLVFQFRMVEAAALLKTLEADSPENRALDYVWSDYHLFRTLVEERDEFRAQFYDAYRLHLNRVFDLDRSNKWRPVVLGELYFKRGLVNTLNNNRLSAARDVYLGYQQFENAYELDSTFYPALLGWGVVQLYTGALPEEYKRYARLIGINGESEFGEKLILESVIESLGEEQNSFYRSHIFFAANYLFIDHEISGLDSLIFEANSTAYPPILFVSVKRLTEERKNRKVVELLSRYEASDNQMRFWYLDYVYGINLVRFNDPDAEKVLLKFLAEYPGESYKKSAALFLSWFYLLNGKIEEAKYYKKRIEDIGNGFVGADKEALNLKEVLVPAPLLRARLLYDSGEHSAADSILNKNPPSTFQKDIDKQNWYYRKGQVQKALGHDEAAINAYQGILQYPFNPSRKFSPAGCVELGKIYLDQELFAEAILWFDKAMEYEGYPYVSDYQRMINRLRVQALEKM